jgi:hypothetical protein
MNKFILSIALCICSLQVYSQGLYEEVSRFQADKGALSRKYNYQQSAEYFQRMDDFYSQQLKELSALAFEKLDRQSQVDYILMRNLLEKEQYFHRLDFDAYKRLNAVKDFESGLREFILERRKGAKPDAQTVAKAMDEVTSKVLAKTTDLSNSIRFGSWQDADLASKMVGSFRMAVDEAFGFYKGYDIELSWWLEVPIQKLQKALRDYEGALAKHFTNTSVKDDGSGIIGKPIGRDALIKSLEFEFIPLSPEALIEIANREFAWCDKEMLKASAELGFGSDWKAALEHVKNTYVPPGKWPEDIYYLANEAVEFIESRNLITVPELAKETWRMNMLSPERQLVSPFFLGGESILIAYPTNTMDHDAKMMSMRGNNPHFSRATVQHELIPGHHLQQFMNQRYKPYRRAFGTPFWTEGWALYWEFNLWDHDFPRSAEDKVGMLFWRMHRCARIIFSLNYHLGNMSPQQCIDFLVDRVGHERANAEAEVRRSFEGSYGPLYQIAYMIGGLQFYELKKELVSSGKMTEKEFHDRILKENTMPVELVRAALTDIPLSRDYKTKWKF